MSAVEKILVRVRVNGGKPREALVEPRTLLVELLREHFNLTGTHIGCDTTYCGACTILLNGRASKSCTMFAPMAEGGEIITIERAFQERRIASGPAGFCGVSRSAMRILYARTASLHRSSFVEDS